MARHGDKRSPSPIDRSYQSSKRNRREEHGHDYTRRDQERRHWAGSRSQSPDVRIKHTNLSSVDADNIDQQRRRRDHDPLRKRGHERDQYRRRDQSTGRRYDDQRDGDSYRFGRRDRSRERRHSRDVNDRYRRRDESYRTRRIDSPDCDRRRDRSNDSRRKGRREESRERRRLSRSPIEQSLQVTILPCLG